MQENNFENRVRQTLDDWSLAPSEPVWLHVQAAIQKKRRRRFLFWMLPLLLTVSGLGVWWLAPVKNSDEKIIGKHNEQKSPQTFLKPHAPSKPIKSTEQSLSKESLASDSFKIERTQIKTPFPASKQRSMPTASLQTKLPKTTKLSSTNNIRNTVDRGLFAPAFSKKSTATELRKINFVEGIMRPIARPKITLQTIADSTEKKRFQIAIVQTNIVIAKPPNLKILRWNLSARIGTSNFTGSLSQITGLKSTAINASRGQYSNSPVFSDSGTNPNAGRYARATRKGLHVGVGVAVQKAFSKRTAFITGLHYRFYQNHQTVGGPLSSDSTAELQNGFNSVLGAGTVYGNSSPRTTVANTLHFVEVPLGLTFQVFPKRPLQVQAGLLVSQLIHSRVLQYDVRNNVYYQQKAALRKTTAHVFLNADYAIWQHKGRALYAGPFVQTSLQPLVKRAPATHLSAAGLAARMAF